MSSRSIGYPPRRLAAILGPTNTGKTHLAVERMLGHASGMIGLPLRLLAREIYERIVKVRGPRSVALITGEEKILPERAVYFVCTAEAMPLNRDVEFLAVDEIQLVADPERGHVFTRRLLEARGACETLLLGAASAGPLLRRLLPEVRIESRERLSRLSWAGARKLTRLPPRSAVVAFSAEAVYALAELIRRHRGGAAVVMGSLSPRTRNAQVALYQSGEVDFLVATDAIGMGLNMDLDHVAFAGASKFDGERMRPLTAQEIAQIAGRAGRHHRDGTFGVTAGCEPLGAGLVDAIEAHRFDPLAAAQWRNARLDFSSLQALLRSLAAPPPGEGLRAAKEALDERTLRSLAADPAIARSVAHRRPLGRLWEACQTPDFRATTLDDHQRLVRALFEQLSGPSERIAETWMTAQFAALDRSGGGIDALSQRLAAVRTLTYIANRPDWLGEPERWRSAARSLEDRLSDELHEGLMARFVDRRTSALVKGLGARQTVLAAVTADGAVTVEGQFVGRLDGLRFEPARGASALEQKMLRAAADRAVGPEIARRLGRLAAEPDEAFDLLPDAVVLWRGRPVGVLANARPFDPAVRLIGETGPIATRERAARRLEAFVAARARQRLAALERLSRAMAGGDIRGLARGLAWRLMEGGGVVPRRDIEDQLRMLSRNERRALRALGVRIGAFCLFLPDQLRNPARGFARAFAAQAASGAPLRHLSAVSQSVPPLALGLAGLVSTGGLLVRVESLEALDGLVHAASRRGKGVVITPQTLQDLGCNESQAKQILRGLGFAPAGRPRPGEPLAWRRRRRSNAPADCRPAAERSPFAALASLAQASPTRARQFRRSHA